MRQLHPLHTRELSCWPYANVHVWETRAHICSCWPRANVHEWEARTRICACWPCAILHVWMESTRTNAGAGLVQLCACGWEARVHTHMLSCHDHAMQAGDLDRDGHVSYDEFVALLRLAAPDVTVRGRAGLRRRLLVELWHASCVCVYVCVRLCVHVGVRMQVGASWHGFGRKD